MQAPKVYVWVNHGYESGAACGDGYDSFCYSTQRPSIDESAYELTACTYLSFTIRSNAGLSCCSGYLRYEDLNVVLYDINVDINVDIDDEANIRFIGNNCYHDSSLTYVHALELAHDQMRARREKRMRRKLRKAYKQYTKKQIS